jgi:nitrate/nitrite transporter NarK
MPHDLAWRLMLGLGAVPAAAVIYLRRTIAETAHFSLGARGDVEGAAQLVEKLTHAPVPERGRVARLKDSWTLLFTDRKYLATLIGTSFSWMFLDMAFYGNSVSSGLVMKDLLPHANLISSTLVSGLIFLVAAVPGYWVAAFTMDRLGRRFIQLLGFVVMGLAYAAIFLFPGVMAVPVEFLLLYAVSYFFIEFGPNCTTFVFPAEVFPVTVRGWGFGISASMGKLGAAVAAFLFPLVLVAFKVPGTMGILAVVSFLGAILTWLTLGEPKGKTLREASREHLLEQTSVA